MRTQLMIRLDDQQRADIEKVAAILHLRASAWVRKVILDELDRIKSARKKNQK